MAKLTIPKNLIKENDLMVIDKESFERVSKENKELRLIMRSIVEGELALRHGKTRSFKEFLKARFPKYAKDY